ncbi:GntR family transcriptional regulator [Nocardioides thalensis]|uniref:GntR family transcriptional regulator n=1 Tax=Nocardioides thalensis TaxID=1914755 RepID=A0A853C0R0_9ACTN|nr:GntR family transcriptional regulator [Nocardioides thalensis]NYJ00616.1 GntR family transcriptional regulator [Nocardioides thalensis]
MTHSELVADQRRRADRARQVADVLRRQVLAGVYDDGPLPAEPALVAEFGTTRNTVRAALDLLRAEGLVDRCPGVGTTVVSRKHHHGLDRLLGLAEVFDGLGTVRNEVRTLTVTRPPAAVRDHLRLGPDDDVVYVERLRHLDGVPLSLDLTYLVPDLGSALLERDLAGSDIFGLLEEVAGQRLGHADLTVEAVSADAHSAAVLGTPRHAALLMVERLTHLEDGRPVDFEFIRFRGDRLTLRGTTRRDPLEA